LNILAWLAFIGFSIKSGAILISFVVSFLNPEAAGNLYNGLNLQQLRQFSLWHYIAQVSFLLVASILGAFVWYMVIRIISKINLENPFAIEVAQKLEKISYVLFAAWLVEMLNLGHVSWMLEITGIKYGSESSGGFLFMAGLMFIISQVFKRGVEIQSENELTV
jgi:hypothetical protein